MLSIESDSDVAFIRAPVNRDFRNMLVFPPKMETYRKRHDYNVYNFNILWLYLNHITHNINAEISDQIALHVYMLTRQLNKIQ